MVTNFVKIASVFWLFSCTGLLLYCPNQGYQSTLTWLLWWLTLLTWLQSAPCLTQSIASSSLSFITASISRPCVSIESTIQKHTDQRNLIAKYHKNLHINIMPWKITTVLRFERIIILFLFSFLNERSIT